MIENLIERYKTYKRKQFFKLTSSFKAKYAFVGTGQHAMANLYPLLHHFNVDVKYIVSKNIDHATSLANGFKNCTPISSIETIIKDKEITGVFACTSPNQHFNIASQLLAAGKNVYVEKPPCYTIEELNKLSSAASNSFCHVGLQQRQAAALGKLKPAIAKAKYYQLEYNTGLYPEGNALYDLFIHPLDLALHLFGEAEIISTTSTVIGDGKIIDIIIEHQNNLKGRISLSTAHSWTNNKELLTIFTSKESYEFNFPFTVKKISAGASLLGVPIEKIKGTVTETTLFNGNNFSTGLTNQNIYLQGFYNAVLHFIKQNEGIEKQENMLPSLQHLYKIMSDIK